MVFEDKFQIELPHSMDRADESQMDKRIKSQIWQQSQSEFSSRLKMSFQPAISQSTFIARQQSEILIQ